YIGFDLIAHCAEKLFSGPIPFQPNAKAFAVLGIPNSELFVKLAGLIELRGTISLGLGFFTRIGAIAWRGR
ncbi:MAG: DoxX family protein, partial [Rickettsiella sp.]|nr:DoxX family protein [Rickettsiella sp.]